MFLSVFIIIYIFQGMVFFHSSVLKKHNIWYQRKINVI